jgi:ABC-type dipeptide/oligopeptide/nickel transport system permease component
MLILLFSIVLGWFPVSGYGSDFLTSCTIWRCRA